jgi:EpsI family protein
MRTRVIILFAVLLLAAGAVARADRYENVPLRTSFESFPVRIGDWQGSAMAPLTPSALAVLGLNDYIVRSYRASEGGLIGLYIGYWQSQRQGDTIHSPQNCLPGAGWEPVSQGIIDIPDSRTPGAVVPVNRYVIQKGADRQVVLYWYQSHGRIVASEYWSKIYLVTDAVRLNRTDGALVRIIAPATDESPEAIVKADRVALRFANALLPELDVFLPR